MEAYLFSLLTITQRKVVDVRRASAIILICWHCSLLLARLHLSPSGWLRGRLTPRWNSTREGNYVAAPDLTAADSSSIPQTISRRRGFKTPIRVCSPSISKQLPVSWLTSVKFASLSRIADFPVIDTDRWWSSPWQILVTPLPLDECGWSTHARWEARGATKHACSAVRCAASPQPNSWGHESRGIRRESGNCVTNFVKRFRHHVLFITFSCTRRQRRSCGVAVYRVLTLLPRRWQGKWQTLTGNAESPPSWTVVLLIVFGGAVVVVGTVVSTCRWKEHVIHHQAFCGIRHLLIRNSDLLTHRLQHNSVGQIFPLHVQVWGKWWFGKLVVGARLLRRFLLLLQKRLYVSCRSAGWKVMVVVTQWVTEWTTHHARRSHFANYPNLSLRNASRYSTPSFVVMEVVMIVQGWNVLNMLRKFRLRNGIVRCIFLPIWIWSPSISRAGGGWRWGVCCRNYSAATGGITEWCCQVFCTALMVQVASMLRWPCGHWPDSHNWSNRSGVFCSCGRISKRRCFGCRHANHGVSVGPLSGYSWR